MTGEIAVRGLDARVTGSLVTFIDVLRDCGNVTEACRQANLARISVYRWRDKDPEFAAAWETALHQAIDSLEAEAWRRARDGVPEFVMSKDGPVTTVDAETGERTYLTQQKFSDVLLITLLKAHRPERFKDRATLDVNITADLAAKMEAARKRIRGE